MKITYLELKNFIGLYNGLGRKEIKIDFSNANNKINILSGSNGSGKSFVLSCLHPFAGTLDNRDKIILDGENGYKKIVYKVTEKKYISIEHNYNQGKTGKITMKSFLSLSEDGGKTYKELNPNGTVKSFKELVLKHLEVEESYFKIARIGTNVTNFIDMPTAERKKYISLFLPDVDIYLENYKKVNEKYLALSRNIKFITSEIDKLDTEENLDNNIKNTENSLKIITESLFIKNDEYSKNKGSITALDPNGELEQEFLSKYNSYNSKKSSLSKIKSSIETIDGKLENNKYSYNEILGELSKCQSELESKRNKVNDLENINIELEADLQENETKLSKYKGFINDELQCTLEEVEERFNSNKEFIDNNIYKNLYEKVSISEVNQAINIVKIYKEASSNILALYDSFVVDLYFNQDLSNAINELEKNKDILKEINDKINSIDVKKRTLMGKLELLDVLNQRPKECTIDSCPFISKALEFSDVDKQIEKLENMSNEYKEKKANIKEAIKGLENLINMDKDITSLFKQVNMYRDILLKLPNSEFITNFDSFKSLFRKDKDNLSYNEIKDLLEVMQENNELEKQISNIKDKIENMKDKKIIVESIEKEITKINSKLISNEKQVHSLRNEYIELGGNHEELTQIKIIMEEKDELVKEKDSIIKDLRVLKERLSEMKSSIDKIKELKIANKEIRLEIDKLSVQKEPLEKEQETLKVNKRRLIEFKESKALLEKDYSDLSIIKDSLSATKGIPLLFIDLYLKKIKTIANDLLNITFKGGFFIEDFKVTESDFFISVRKEEGELVNDVSQASQGEQALISIALSFALIQQSTKSYNVLALDEMDSTLDHNNRRTFIEVIENQLKELNIEQCFIISHNEAFDTYPVNLLLFKGTHVDTNDIEYMKNKNIIFQNK